MTDKQYREYKLLIELTDSDYPPFFTVPLFASIGVVVGFCFAVFWTPLALLGILSIVAFGYLLDWQTTTYAKLNKEPDEFKILYRIHSELRAKYDLDR